VRASAQPSGVGNETMSWLSSSQLASGAGSRRSRPPVPKGDQYVGLLHFNLTEEAYHAFNLALDARRANSHHNSNRAFQPLTFLRLGSQCIVRQSGIRAVLEGTWQDEFLRSPKQRKVCPGFTVEGAK
jgi:hypothetical protein